MKRILAIILTVILVLSSFTFAFAGDGALNLKDVGTLEVDLDEGQCDTITINISATGTINQESDGLNVKYPTKITLTSQGPVVNSKDTFDFYKNETKEFEFDITICAEEGSSSIEIDLFQDLTPRVPGVQANVPYIELGGRIGLQGNNASAILDITVTEPAPTYYTVNFIDHDGIVLKTEEVLEGDDATAPSDPSRDGYTFTKWDTDFTNVQSDLDVYAEYSENLNPDTDTYYTVRFIDHDDTVLKTEEVLEGDDATAPSDPTRDGHTFTGWDKEYTNIQGDLDVYAEYIENPDADTYYTVRFIDHDETVLKTEEVLEGDDATAPSDPRRDGYTFTRWDTDFTNVQSDIDVYAQYERDTVIVTDPTYSVLLTALPAEGGKVVGYGKYKKNDPVTIKATPNEGFKFKEWKLGEKVENTLTTHNFTMPAQNLTLTAVFEKESSGGGGGSTNPPVSSNIYEMSIEKIAVQDEVYVGDYADFEITVSNEGNTRLGNITVKDDMTGLNETINLNERQSRTFKVSVKTEEVGLLTNTAEAIHDTASFTRDSASVKVIALEIEDEENPQGNPEPEKDPKDEPEKEDPKDEEVVIEEIEEETPQNVPDNEKPVKDPKTEEILDETVPLDLPDTGVLPVELFYGLGALISGAGVLISKKKH